MTIRLQQVTADVDDAAHLHGELSRASGVMLVKSFHTSPMEIFLSAPKTDIDKQKRRHFTPLVGIALAVAFGFGMFLLYSSDAVDDAEGPVETTGEMQETSPPASEDAGAVDAPASTTDPVPPEETEVDTEN